MKFSLNPLKWFSDGESWKVPGVQIHKADSHTDLLEKNICETVLKGCVPQFLMCGFQRSDMTFDGRAGSLKVLCYVSGYVRAVHRHIESSSGVAINDANVTIATLSGLFVNDTFENACDASLRAQAALAADADGAREAFVLGANDFGGDATPWGVPGIVHILGIGGQQ